MSTIVFRQLIDAAIGSPDPGHVDFCALQCVLYHFADKLNLLDCVVDNKKFSGLFCMRKKSNRRPSKCLITSAPSRLLAGSDDIQAEVAREEKSLTPEEQAMEPEASLNESVVVGTQQLEAQVEENFETLEVPDIESELATSVVTDQNIETDKVEQSTRAADATYTGPGVQENLEPAQASEKPASIYDEDRHLPLTEIRTESIKSADGKIQYLYEPISEDLLMGISIMKDQIELSMEQINMLINMAISGKRRSLVSALKDVNKKMRHIQRANFYIESKSKASEQDYTSNEIFEADIEDNEEFEEAEAEVEYSTTKSIAKIEHETVAGEAPILVEPTLEYHLCYTPERIMDELLELKSEFCNLTNKVNDSMVALQEIDSQRTKVILSDLQEQVRELRHIFTILKDGQEFLNKKQKVDTEKLFELDKIVMSLRMNKVEKADMELALAEKVDYELLEHKVSHDQLKEALCRIEKQFCETQRLINFNEKHALQVIENMRKNLGLDSIDQMLKAFRDKVDQDIEKLQEILQNYIDSTNDECAAAGARVQVLKDLACISCDTQCVMRTMEKCKVGKLRNAHVSPGLGPLITYEIGSIRKSGLMGYFRKDEFPHAPNAWMNRKNISLNMCLPRHAGGEHTTHTAKELVQKVVKRSK